MLRLYDFLEPGNGYKVRLLLHRLDLPFQLVERDITKGETRTPAFLAKNPNGRIPTLELEDGTCLAESNAILCYLAEGTPLWPTGRLARARTLQWLFFEQYSHEPCIAVARAWRHLFGLTPEREAQLPAKMKGGYQALDVMERALTGRRFLVDDRFGVADIALYAYTHVAHEGGFDLAWYPAVRAWLDRVAAEPRHVPITWRPDEAPLALDGRGDSGAPAAAEAPR
ncbi:MAG: glutathione S-transferase family protein [Rhodospirillaceae bacterium]|nr:glutathione S-transferase family protein [Rhodospirillaceae bacterium]